ncbi:MAG TPA: outer membrane beta-barrel protein [Longimicrobiales bacterium]|nr:outer membrane beta-barrel protein [Longimicrobiales bacterium]
MKRLALLAAFALFLAAAPASAQFAVYGGGGAAIPTGDDLEDVESGLQLLGGFTYDLSEKLSLYGEGQWGTHDIEDSDISVSPSALMAGLLLGLAGDEDAALSPYLFGGLGLQTLSVDDDGSDPSDSAFGYQVGAGVGFDLGSLPTFLEGRYQAASFDADSEVGELDFSIFSIILGFSFDLGGDN